MIPAYNHGRKIADVIEKALGLHMPVIVVDDGSTDSTYDKIRNIKGIRILRHSVNLGKGAALLTGFKEAEKMADWAITLDADGQHRPEDAIALIRAIPDGRRPIVVGKRTGMREAEAPWTSRFGRGFSNFWVHVSGGPLMTDSQSGFRIYPIPEAGRLDVKARRYQFEVEVLVKAKREGIPVIEAPVQAIYGEHGKKDSHFHPFYDFWRNFATFSRLITKRIFESFKVRH